MYRVHPDRWDGVADLNNPPVARQYLDEFDEIWHASAPDEQARQAIATSYSPCRWNPEVTVAAVVERDGRYLWSRNASPVNWC